MTDPLELGSLPPTTLHGKGPASTRRWPRPLEPQGTPHWRHKFRWPASVSESSATGPSVAGHTARYDSRAARVAAALRFSANESRSGMAQGCAVVPAEPRWAGAR